jgi:hypothetical protein
MKEKKSPMTLPGLSAGSSLYRSALHYCLSAVHHQANGVTLQELPSGISASQPHIVYFPHLLCQPCVQDPILGCAQECVLCPDPYPSPHKGLGAPTVIHLLFPSK